MKKFKEFLENYDFYIDMPMGFKKPESDNPDDNEEDTTEKIIMKPTREAEKEAKKAETIDIAMEG